jgi:hypothetical protein
MIAKTLRRETMDQKSNPEEHKIESKDSIIQEVFDAAIRKDPYYFCREYCQYCEDRICEKNGK